jgi:hypothetical protein
VTQASENPYTQFVNIYQLSSSLPVLINQVLVTTINENGNTTNLMIPVLPGPRNNSYYANNDALMVTGVQNTSNELIIANKGVTNIFFVGIFPYYTPSGLINFIENNELVNTLTLPGSPASYQSLALSTGTNRLYTEYFDITGNAFLGYTDPPYNDINSIPLNTTNLLYGGLVYAGTSNGIDTVYAYDGYNTLYQLIGTTLDIFMNVTGVLSLINNNNRLLGYSFSNNNIYYIINNNIGYYLNAVNTQTFNTTTIGEYFSVYVDQKNNLICAINNNGSNFSIIDGYQILYNISTSFKSIPPIAFNYNLNQIYVNNIVSNYPQVDIYNSQTGQLVSTVNYGNFIQNILNSVSFTQTITYNSETQSLLTSVPAFPQTENSYSTYLFNPSSSTITASMTQQLQTQGVQVQILANTTLMATMTFEIPLQLPVFAVVSSAFCLSSFSVSVNNVISSTKLSNITAVYSDGTLSITASTHSLGTVVKNTNLDFVVTYYLQ